MAGFLFRKQKQDHNNSNRGSVVISSPTTLQSPPSTPLYARFTAPSPRDTNSIATSPVRKVSLPKPLGNQGRGQRGEKVWNGLEGKYGYSSNSLTSVDRDGQRRNLKVQNTAQHPQLSEHTLAKPVSRLLLDKPLPPPVPPTEDKPTIVTTTTLAPRPTAFPTQQQVQGRMSLNSEKPLPRPGSSQSFLPAPGIPTASSKSSLSRTTSPSTPSILTHGADIQTNIQRQLSTSTPNQTMSEEPSQTESTTPMKTQDLPAGTFQNGPISESLVPTPSSTSTDSINSTQRTTRQGTSSEGVMDHPEALSLQNSDEINHVPSQSSSFNSRRPPLDRGSSSASGKSFDRQSLVSTPAIREVGGDMTLFQPIRSPVKQPTLQRGLPSPPSTPMGSNASSLSRASMISPYHELYPSHVIMDNERRYSVLDANQQRPPLHRNLSVAQASFPTPPPANPYSFLDNGISERQPLHVSRNRSQQHPYPEHHQAALTSPHSRHVSLTQASLQSNVSLPRGKPRIFAAMEAQESGRLYPVPHTSPPLFSPQEIQQSIQAPPLTRQSLEEEYSTPRLQFESLPEIKANGDVDFSGTAKATDPHNVAPGLEPHPVHHSRKSSGSRFVPRQDDSRKQNIPQPPRTKKLSKVRQPTDGTIHGHTSNGSTSTLPGTPDSGQQKKLNKTLSKSRLLVSSEPEPTIQLDEETIRNAGIPLDDDPFAKVEGVKMLKTTSTPNVRQKSMKENSSPNGDFDGLKEQLGRPQQENASQVGSVTHSHRQTRKDKKERPPLFLLDPALKREPPEPATMPRLLLDPQILAILLQFLSFYEWCIILSLSKEIRFALVRNAALRETALEVFLKTVGYSRWTWDDEPLSLSLQDLGDYMRGVSTPTHEYARVAAIYIHSLKMPTTHRDPSIRLMVQRFVASTRAYNRVLLRLRAQAEKEASLSSSVQTQAQSPGARTFNARLSPTNRGGNSSRASSRPPSPAASHTSVNTSNGQFPRASQTNLAFHSMLFKLRRAPLLRVFVPSPEGDWLSDKSILECEAECKRAGVQHLLRLGDVVWDVAVGDEGNVGRLVWDGTYLIDLDYTYSTIGDLPKYLPALSFPPSYFHRVVRTDPSNSNPIVHIDITPWGQEIVTNVDLIQDRVRTETSQGAYHNVMRWVHRSSFQLRPVRGQQPGVVNRIPIPNTDNLFVDPGWYGAIVVETEGTNEGLADLQDRCGLGASPPRQRAHAKLTQAQIENRKVFRILRERSRPGEIWIRAVSMKERLL